MRKESGHLTMNTLTYQKSLNFDTIIEKSNQDISYKISSSSNKGESELFYFLASQNAL